VTAPGGGQGATGGAMARHGTSSSYRKCHDGPGGGPCDTCVTGRRAAGAARMARSRERHRDAQGHPGIPPVPDGSSAHGATRPPVTPGVTGPVTPGHRAAPGAATAARGRSGPGGATGAATGRPSAGEATGHGATVAAPGGPRWAMPEATPEPLRSGLAAWLATTWASGPQHIAATRAEGQSRAEFKAEVKSLADALAEFGRLNPGLGFRYQGLSRSDGYPMFGFNYTGYYVEFADPNEIEEVPDIPRVNYPPIPAPVYRNAPAVPSMGPETRAQFARDAAQRDAQARQTAAARREEANQAEITRKRQERDCGYGIHGQQITDPVSGRIHCGLCKETLRHGYPPDREWREGMWSD
jgi:hypothetical protein